MSAPAEVTGDGIAEVIVGAPVLVDAAPPPDGVSTALAEALELRVGF